MKHVHGFVVLYFVVVIFSALEDSCDTFIEIHVYLTGTIESEITLKDTAR